MAVSQALLQQLLSLGERDRVEIAHVLLASVGENDEVDEMNEAERSRFHATLERSIADVDAGRTFGFDEVIASLRAKRAARMAR